MKHLLLAVVLAITTSAFGQQKKSAQYYYEKGEEALARKEYITAQAHFSECLRINPLFAEAYRARAIAREHLGEKARALTDYNVYVDLKPDDGEGLFSRAVLRFESNQHMLARQDFIKLLSIPKNAETNTVYFTQEQYSDAGGSIITARNSRPVVYNYLGLIEIKIPRFDKAVQWFDSALFMLPTEPSFWVNRGLAHLGMKNHTAALSDFNKALSLDPDNTLALHNIAQIKATVGEPDASEKLLTAAIEKNKNHPAPRAERGWHRLQKNDLQGALEDYSEAIRLDPLDHENYINRGLVREKLKDLPGAAEDFSKAVSLAEKDPRAWMEHGNVMVKQQKWQLALEDYTMAIRLKPDYGLAYYNRAVARHSTGQNKLACQDLQLAEKHGYKGDAAIKAKVCK